MTEWYEESAEEFANSFSEQRQVHHKIPQEQDLEATYGPSAPYSEYKRGNHIRYIDASGEQRSGMIVWCQASAGDIQMKYVVAPDDPGEFLDFVLPGDVLTQDETPSADTLARCPWCGAVHLAQLIDKCPLKPKGEG
ncbi:MAG TPA: hypothetical protein VEL31_24825 [Ktedonobacteraceae bacterium]|nr:hypothetical protein [Ktedonobacteraceae bacterium]